MKNQINTQKDLKAISKIESSKEIQNKMKGLKYYENANFLSDAKQYIKAIKTGSMFCVINSVSNSGMSRVINFYSSAKSKDGRFYYRNYNCFFIALGYTETKEGFRISGCGMDMIFHTNYCIINTLFSLGIINKKQCSQLAQNTPNKF